MEIVYVYQKKRRDFGKQSTFSDRAPELGCSIPPDHEYSNNYYERNPCQQNIQAVPEQSEHEVFSCYIKFITRLVDFFGCDDIYRQTQKAPKPSTKVSCIFKVAGLKMWTLAM